VLDAAEELFGEMSYDAASVEDIARRAELSVASLYNLFEGKREIYKATIARAHARFFYELEARVDAARGPLAAVRAIVAYHFEHFTRYERQFRVFVLGGSMGAMEIKAEVEREARQRQAQFFSRVADICQRGLDEGVFKQGLRPEQLALALLSIPHSLLTYWLDNEGVELATLAPRALTMVDRLIGADG